MTLAIETHHLRKQFGDKVAVADLSIRVECGEIFGFLGQNGAGKTTSVKMLLGLVHPTSGEATLLGKPLGNTDVRQRVGFLPEHFRFHGWLSAVEFLRFHANLFRMETHAADQRIPEMLALVGLSQHANKKLRAFSKGMLQRIGLAQALLNQPDLVFLDEPTSGLDPIGRRLVRDIIKDLRERGTAVFINSHLLSEIEVTCDRVAFIKQGEIVRIGTLQTLMEGDFTVQIRVRNLSDATQTGLTRWATNIRAMGSEEESMLTFNISDEACLPEINRFLIGEGVDVFSMRPERHSLEDVFLEIVGSDTSL